MIQDPSASGEYPVILFAVSVASAYVVTPTRDYSQPERSGFSNFYSSDPNRSVALMPKYNAHFVPVKYSGLVHCVTGRQLQHDTDYQAATEGVDASEAAAAPCDSLRPSGCVTHSLAAAHELVALSPEQALPVAVVWLRR